MTKVHRQETCIWASYGRCMHALLVSVFLLSTVYSANLTYTVQNFVSDFSGAAIDTSHLGSMGGNLSIAVESRVLQHGLTPVDLTNGVTPNGRAGANPVVRSLPGGRDFRVAYIAWNNAQSPNAGPMATYIPPQGNIILRKLSVSDNGALLDTLGVVIASAENPTDDGKIFYGGAQDRRPPPSYLQFAAGTSGAYTAYWSTLQLSGSLRRTSDVDSAGRFLTTRYARYVPPTTPDVLGYVGTVGMASIPGTNSRQTILAYDRSISPASATVRWENISSGSSQSVNFSRPGVSLMEDFAVGADAAGNALILWREADTLMAIGYTSGQTVVMNARPVAGGPISGELVPAHSYRSYGVAPLSNNNFVITYARSGQIFYRTVDIQNNLLGTETALTASGFDCIYPDVSVSSGYILFTWYGNTNGGTRQVSASRFTLSGGAIQSSSRADYRVSLADVSFNVGEGWKPWHNFRVPVGAINDIGDFAVAYDHEFGAKLSAWVNLPLFWDTASFTSRTIRLGNASTNIWADPSQDSVAILEVSHDAGASARLSLAFASNPTIINPNFVAINSSGLQNPPLIVQAGYFKYRMQLLAQQSRARNTSVDSLYMRYNVKPRQPTVTAALLGGVAVAWRSDTTFSLYARKDTLGLTVRGYDVDQAGLKFNYSGYMGNVLDTSAESQGSGIYISRPRFAPTARQTRNTGITIRTIDSLGWNSSSLPISVHFINAAPQISANMLRRDKPLTGAFQTYPIQTDSHYVAFARDSARIVVTIADANDDSVQLTLLKSSTQVYTSKVAVGQAISIPIFNNRAASKVNFVLQISDPDTSVQVPFALTFQNSAPQMELGVRYRPELAKGSAIDTSVSAGDTLRIWARDTSRLDLSYSDDNDTLNAIRVRLGDIVLIDSSLTRNVKLQRKFIENKGFVTRELIATIQDADTTVEHRFYLYIHNDVPTLSAALLKNRGADMNGRFKPNAGIVDTLTPSIDSLVVFHFGDSSFLALSFNDTLDDSLQVEVLRENVSEWKRTFADSSKYNLLVPGQIPKDSFSIEVRLRDPDTSTFYRFRLGINQLPTITKVSSTSEGKPLSQIESFKTTPQIRIIPTRENEITVQYQNAESEEIEWYLWTRPDSCARGRLSCYESRLVNQGPSLTRSYVAGEEKMLLRITDGYGAFIQDTLDLVFPFLDTNAQKSSTYTSSIAALLSSKSLVIGSKETERIDTLRISNTGSGPLLFSRIATGLNNESWFKYQLFWNSQLGPQQPMIDSRTDRHPLDGPLRLAPGGELEIHFHFFVDSLKGDSRLSDVFYLESDDYFQPQIVLPFALSYRDLPTVQVQFNTNNPRMLSGGRAKIQKSHAPEDSVPLKSTIVLKFSEPVWDSTLDSSSVFIYSQCDSAKAGTAHSIGSYFSRYFYRYAGLDHQNRRDTLRTDSIVFAPQYRDTSECYRVIPPPGNFLPRDEIRIRLNNSITDTAGNPLDLFLSKIPSTAGTQDSMLAWKIVSSTLEVSETHPDSNAEHNPDRPIQVKFNRPVVQSYIHDRSGVTYLSADTGTNLPALGRSIRITSAMHPEPFDFRYIRQRQGDSILEFQTMPKYFSGDTVMVSLYSRIGDGLGLTLDGNRDGMGRFWYNEADTTDRYTFSFIAQRAEFYLYPNPFRMSNEAHARKGTITFKNWNRFKGLRYGDRVDFRIYTLSADLVYSSSRNDQSPIWQPGMEPVWDWDLKNDFGNMVASGLYIYQVTIRGDAVQKGKVAILR